MFEKYVLLNIKTPNTRGNSICAIAVILVEDNKVVEKKYSLINPEDEFDDMNSKITGIDASQVRIATTLKEYWNEIKELIEENVIIAHNAIYDLTVLSRALQRYNIKLKKYCYSSTFELSKKYIRASSYKLMNLVQTLNYEYHVQDALEEAMACEHLFQYIKSHNTLSENVLHTSFFTEMIVDKIEEHLISNRQNLSGLIQGILFDGVVKKTEIARLKKWVEDNSIYKSYTMFANIIDTLTSILEDNSINQYNQLRLRSMSTKFSSSEVYCRTTQSIQVLRGVIEGILCDGRIHEMEIVKLKGWLEDHDYLTGIYPYDKLVRIVCDVDGAEKLELEERRKLLEVFREINDPVSAHTNLRNCFPLENKTFCLTGEFVSASRNTIVKKLEERGAIKQNTVSVNLDYLFVGGMPTDIWKFGNTNPQIDRAMELQKKGANLLIVAEEELEGVVISR